MGVDLSISQVVGVILDPKGLKEWQQAVDPEGNLYGEEYLYEQFSANERDGIEFGTAGSYYDNQEMQHYLYSSRVSEHYSDHDIPGGIVAGPSDHGIAVLSNSEAVRLLNLAKYMGTKNPEIKQFLAVLWH